MTSPEPAAAGYVHEGMTLANLEKLDAGKGILSTARARKHGLAKTSSRLVRTQPGRLRPRPHRT